VPKTTILDIPPAEQAQMRAALRRARSGYLLALHVLLLCAAGHTPTEIAPVLFCSRSSVYRIVRLYHAQQRGCTVDEDGPWAAPVRTPVLLPWIPRSLAALLKVPPRTSGWCRTRWSCAPWALALHAKHGLDGSAWTVRRWLHDLGWGWKRAKRVAKDNEPQRVERLARLRWQLEHLQAQEVLVCADELDIQLVPKVGAA
jgi:transposase